MVATLAIQCRPAPDKPPGCFLYIGNHWWATGNGEGFQIVSPVFPDLVAFYDWQQKSEWIALPRDPDRPTGAFTREES